MEKSGHEVTDANSKVEVTEILYDLIEEYQPSFEKYQWPRESMRWKELVFCILETLSSREIAEKAVNALSELDLVNIEKLSPKHGSARKTSLLKHELIQDILQEAGFESGTAKQALNALVEIAEIVQTKYGGKVQRLLRKEGEQMIRNITSFFTFHTLEEQLTRRIIIKWLQDVLNLPIYRETEGSKAFLVETNTTVAELVDAADDLDINIAIVDDLLSYWYDMERVTKDLVDERARSDR